MRWSEAQYAAFVGGKAPKKAGNTVIAGGYKAHWTGKVTVGEHTCFFRSLWEHNYACFLEWELQRGAIDSWEHEPHRFCFKHEYKRGPYSYLPDYKVTTDGIVRWHEVKGWMNSKSKSKIKRFEKCFPKAGKVIVIDKTWFTSMSRSGVIIPGWMTLQEALARYPGKTKA